MSKPDPVRVCVLIDDGELVEWQRRALDRMVAETDAEITVVVSNEADASRTRMELLHRAIELREWTLVWAARKLFGTTLPERRPVTVDELACVSAADRIDCVPETVDGWKNALPPDVVDAVTDRADVAIRFGFGFLVGDILTDLPHGVLSYHHGDIREYRGQPAGCWEFIHGRDEAGITLQRINERIDAGEVLDLKTISIADADTHYEVKSRLYGHSEDMLATAIGRLDEGQTEFETYQDLGDLYTIPTGTDAIRFMLKDLVGHLRRGRNRPANTRWES